MTEAGIYFMWHCSNPQYSVCQLIESSSPLPHSYSQLCDLLRSACGIKHDTQSGPEQENCWGRERLTVSHQNIHHPAECHFWPAHGQKTLPLSRLCAIAGGGGHMAPSRPCSSYDRCQLASSVHPLHSVLVKDAACQLQSHNCRLKMNV